MCSFDFSKYHSGNVKKLALIYQNIGHIILMLILLCCSAFFSGAETAFFNLTRKQINLLKESKHRLHNLVVKLLDKPKRLLGCLLFGNMTVNVLFFAASSVVTIRITNQISGGAGAITAFAAFSILVLFGEILPKSLAFANSNNGARLVLAKLLPAMDAQIEYAFRSWQVRVAGRAQVRTRRLARQGYKAPLRLERRFRTCCQARPGRSPAGPRARS